MSDNEIASIPGDICKLKRLSDLIMIANKITELPDCIAVMPNLTMLDVTGNDLGDIPRINGAYPSLKHLFIDADRVRRECLKWLNNKPYYS